jgi:hypothetical protein
MRQAAANFATEARITSAKRIRNSDLHKQTSAASHFAILWSGGVCGLDSTRRLAIFTVERNRFAVGRTDFVLHHFHAPSPLLAVTHPKLGF